MIYIITLTLLCRVGPYGGVSFVRTAKYSDKEVAEAAYKRLLSSSTLKLFDNKQCEIQDVQFGQVEGNE